MCIGLKIKNNWGLQLKKGGTTTTTTPRTRLQNTKHHANTLEGENENIVKFIPV